MVENHAEATLYPKPESRSEAAASSPNENDDRPFVVGVGASAGGLEAIERVFERMPADTGMAFVIVQHLSPDFKSVMNEVLARWTTMRIHYAENGLRVEANSIYLIPPKKEMVISDGRLLLTDKDAEAPLSLPIDHFLRSLGQDCQQRSIAIILSGTGSDGSRGVVDVHESGGLVISQSEETAKFDGMPRAARESGVVDLVLAPEDVPSVLENYIHDPRITEAPRQLDNTSLDETGLTRVFTLIRDAYGLDFSHYKLNTVVRRTERRFVLSRAEHIDEYVEKLESDPAELALLYKDLLIGVTRFFRDPGAFEKLASDSIHDLVERLPAGAEARAWVAGCATGEEAYTIAMLLDEASQASGKRLQIKLFATDVHKESLETAAQGVYPQSSLNEMPSERVTRYFTTVGSSYQVRPSLRQMVVFAPHNLTKDAPFTKLDLITCRNLLIYLQPQAQKKILSLFHFGLKTGGCLMLGPSESPGDLVEDFETLDRSWKIYRKRRETRLPSDVRLQLTGMTRGGGAAGPLSGHAGGDSISADIYDALLESALPPSLLVNEQGVLLHTFGDAGVYLQTERGRHTAELRDRLVNDLRLPVATAIGKALKDDEAVSYAGVRLKRDDGEEIIAEVTAEPIRTTNGLTRHVLIRVRPVEIESGPPESERRLVSESLSADQITALETELRYTKENLQATIEELETSNEELQATNEELVASNEELQSTNEELHSVNEELYTINSEHQNKIVELSELTRDMDNLLQCTEVDTVFLDKDLRIRKFTPRAGRRFNFLPQDVGRRIDTFTHEIRCEGFTSKVQTVLDTAAPHEEEVRGRDGDCYLMRVLPYRAPTSDASHPEGVLLTLVDITKLRAASDALAESIQQRDRFLAMLSHELRNPLATIVNAARLLSTSDASEQRGESLDVIARQSKQMSALLDDLLDVTRVCQGKIQFSRRPFDLTVALRGALDSVEAACVSRQQTISSHLPEESIWIEGSEPRMQQVVTNLLTNASKYSPPGSEIVITLREEEEQAVISVRDHGVGISKDHLGKIFDLFVQSDRTLDRADGGLGVGLTLVRSLVRLHRGEVTVDSAGEGQGSEFRVRLPTCPEPPEPVRVDSPHASLGIRRLVLVEDNLDASKMMAYLLEDTGYEVSLAHDGARGLELIRKNRPDAAIVDLGLPELNGYELARAVRSDSSFDSMFLIALTGYGQPADRAKSSEAGFDEHLVKPVDPTALNALLAGLPARHTPPQPHLRIDARSLAAKTTETNERAMD